MIFLVVTLFATCGFINHSLNALRKSFRNIVVSGLFDIKMICDFIPATSNTVKK